MRTCDTRDIKRNLVLIYLNNIGTAQRNFKMICYICQTNLNSICLNHIVLINVMKETSHSHFSV